MLRRVQQHRPVKWTCVSHQSNPESWKSENSNFQHDPKLSVFFVPGVTCKYRFQDFPDVFISISGGGVQPRNPEKKKTFLTSHISTLFFRFFLHRAQTRKLEIKKLQAVGHRENAGHKTSQVDTGGTNISILADNKATSAPVEPTVPWLNSEECV